jgi:hypothetical protein
VLDPQDHWSRRVFSLICPVTPPSNGTSATTGRMGFWTRCRMSNVIIWDIETVPDIKGFAAAKDRRTPFGPWGLSHLGFP